MEQTGFLYKFDPRDYVLGVNSPLTGEDINASGDWISYKPSDEKQSSFSFDTMSCTTFSGTSDLETFLNFCLENKMLSEAQVKFCIDNGYIENGKFNFSDRFSAIVNGTMPNGNYFPNVWDSFRKDGLIPEKDLPFGGKSQAEYLDKKLITQAMRDKAQKFLEVMFEKDASGYKLNYEWVPVTTGIELSNALKQAPVQVAVTAENPRHAILLLRIDTEFESYKPFTRARNRTIAYALKPVIKLKKDPISRWKYFKNYEVIGLKTGFVDLLDKAREFAGISFVITSGLRTLEKNKEVGGSPTSAHLEGTGADIRARNWVEVRKIVDGASKAGITGITVYAESKHVHLDLKSIRLEVKAK